MGEAHLGSKFSTFYMLSNNRGALMKGCVQNNDGMEPLFLEGIIGVEMMKIIKVCFCCRRTKYNLGSFWIFSSYHSKCWHAIPLRIFLVNSLWFLSTTKESRLFNGQLSPIKI